MSEWSLLGLNQRVRDTPNLTAWFIHEVFGNKDLMRLVLRFLLQAHLLNEEW